MNDWYTQTNSYKSTSLAPNRASRGSIEFDKNAPEQVVNIGSIKFNNEVNSESQIKFDTQADLVKSGQYKSEISDPELKKLVEMHKIAEAKLNIARDEWLSAIKIATKDIPNAPLPDFTPQPEQVNSISKQEIEQAYQKSKTDKVFGIFANIGKAISYSTYAISFIGAWAISKILRKNTNSFLVNAGEQMGTLEFFTKVIPQLKYDPSYPA